MAYENEGLITALELPAQTGALLLNQSQGVMGKFSLFAFGANESSACMCLYQKCSRCGKINFQQSAIFTPARKKKERSFPSSQRLFLTTSGLWLWP